MCLRIDPLYHTTYLTATIKLWYLFLWYSRVFCLNSACFSGDCLLNHCLVFSRLLFFFVQVTTICIHFCSFRLLFLYLHNNNLMPFFLTNSLYGIYFISLSKLFLMFYIYYTQNYIWKTFKKIYFIMIL